MEERKRAKRKIGLTLTTCRGSSAEITLDLIQEILKVSPVKTLAKFLCVSKEYSSIIRNRDFMKSYLIKSSSSFRPQSLMFTFEGLREGRRFIFSALQPQDRGKPTSSSSATHLMTCESPPYITVSPSIHGLICHGHPSQLKVYNPSTRRSITLPKIDSKRIEVYHQLGYDPIDGDYKVLCMVKGMHVIYGYFLAHELKVLTLGKENSWRKIENFPPHCLCLHDSPDLCVNGVLYYVALTDTADSHAVMSFDVRTEKFDLILGPDRHVSPMLTRYKGKPALLFAGIGDCIINLWVLENAENHEWSKKAYGLPTIEGKIPYFLYIFGTNDDGEIVLAPETVCTGPFYVVYYHPEKNRMRRVYIEGISELKVPLWNRDSDHMMISVLSDQVDNLMFF